MGVSLTGLRLFRDLTILPHLKDNEAFVALGKQSRRARLASALIAAFVTAPLGAQQPAQPPQVTPEVGQMAPDFSIPGATRYGLLKPSIRLSDLRGQTVVLAFFVQARTRG
jgi:hypothetical protein